MASSSKPKRERRSVREESRAAYREAILEAAMRLFGQTGFHEAKMSEIATEAGVATGTLYNYFSSKEEIFQSILDNGRAQLVFEVEQLAAVEDPLARLAEIVRVMFAFLEEHGALFTVYMQLGGDPTNFRRANNCEDEQFHHHFLTLLSASISEAGDRIRQDYPAETLAWVFGGLMHGAITQWIFGGCKPGLREQSDLIMDMFLNGATPR
ncbi:Fatty acid metabolism regulator protein [Enhygromyxa salina]|uniref:Fatty acid metabolism regulator protein n=1 Tax=Enhygromyxa salina TaxID=215803 RepID=A0A2S9XDX1_9BACT|nr:TetR/AcrR family transcriptional regulator [Enhygromyxa salina]PRP91053.1 Fatty acid metabolism regulator protein [Enhygromyxa salina]